MPWSEGFAFFGTRIGERELSVPGCKKSQVSRNKSLLHGVTSLLLNLYSYKSLKITVVVGKFIIEMLQRMQPTGCPCLLQASFFLLFLIHLFILASTIRHQAAFRCLPVRLYFAHNIVIAHIFCHPVYRSQPTQINCFTQIT